MCETSVTAGTDVSAGAPIRTGSRPCNPTREEAVEAGRDEARRRKIEHLVHHLDGTIGERKTYGHDPRDITG